MMFGLKDTSRFFGVDVLLGRQLSILVRVSIVQTECHQCHFLHYNHHRAVCDVSIQLVFLGEINYIIHTQ